MEKTFDNVLVMLGCASTSTLGRPSVESEAAVARRVIASALVFFARGMRMMFGFLKCWSSSLAYHV